MPAAASKEAAVDKMLDANRRSMLIMIKRVEVRIVSALCVWTMRGAQARAYCHTRRLARL